MKIPGVSKADKVIELLLMLLWVVTHHIIVGKTILLSEDNENKDVIMLWVKFTYLLNSLRFKLLT